CRWRSRAPAESCQWSIHTPVHHETGFSTQQMALGVQHVQIGYALGVESELPGRCVQADCDGFAAAQVKSVQPGEGVGIVEAVDTGPDLLELAVAEKALHGAP